jgi:hypothetical protein
MIFHPKEHIKTEGSFVFSGNVHATCHPCLNKPIIKEFWQNFTFKTSELTVSECDEYIFSVGNAKKLPLGGYAYSINVEKEGICLCADTEKDLINGFMTLIDLFKAAEAGESTVIEVECCEILDRAAIKNRMVHFCIFPETELWELERFIRFCGALKYTHIVLEFWGMLRYDCLKELSWDNAFSKEQIRPIIALAGDLGLEVIPMFNHWGHASASRVMHGKHVILDQNPTLQTYFSEDGWCWDIRKPKVRELLRKIRSELIELCGDGHYFHIGCDEAYNFEFTKENMDFICDFINEIRREMSLSGRRIIAWGDMFLYKHEHYRKENRYTCNAPAAEVEEYLLNGLDKNIIIADWQYHPEHFPVETASVFKQKGFECLLCPWDTSRNHIKVMTETVKEEQLMGLLHTTWHTLSKGLRYVLVAAVYSFEYGDAVASFNTGTYSAALMRKVMPSNGDYRKAGWSKAQIGFSW